LHRAYEIIQKDPGELIISLTGKIDMETAATLLLSLRTEINKKAPSSLTIDLKNVAYLDDFGVLVLLELKNETISRNGSFLYTGASERTEEILALTDFEGQCDTALSYRRKKINPIIRLGEGALVHADNVRFMIAFLGSVFLSLFHVCLHPRSLRLDDTVNYMEKTGVDALPIVGLISFLLGLVIAFTSSIQLQQFGANVYVASLVVFSMVSELGPIMTAIIVAGRSGSAFAAEIGTMEISEEIDALFVMGFQPTLFLAVPRIIALIIVVPLLTLFSDIFAVAGGLVVGVSILDLSPNAYISQTIETITLFEVMWGLSKSVVFASLIAWIGCLRGFQARGGASAVGNAATSAVVSSIFLIILFDSFFAVIRSYWG
jgi:phospholipid/cholesterol/gamma-HCH transport system permease protein